MRLGDLDKAEAVLRNIANHLKESDKEDLAWAFAYAAADVIQRQPTVDAAFVRHGEWKHNDNYVLWAERYVCSECGRNAPSDGDYRLDLTNYCPNCGAKMDGGGVNDGE